MTAACLAFAAVVYAPLAAISWPGSLPSASVLAAVAGLAVVCTAAAFLLFFALIAEAGPARASVITYVNPAVAVALGVLVLGESVTPLILGAFALILGGSVLATRKGERRRGVADSRASEGGPAQADVALEPGAGAVAPAPAGQPNRALTS
jgi:drug/metabolite transporter (DMT)-like permease